VSPGEVGGVFAGVIALLGLLGKAAQWTINWRDARRKTRAAGLQQWEDKLQQRETELDGRINNRLQGLEHEQAVLRQQNHALRLAFELVAGAVRSRDPGEPALKRAEQLLEAAFPLDPTIPAEMGTRLGAIDRLSQFAPRHIFEDEI
jgi:hypothetical protein